MSDQDSLGCSKCRFSQRGCKRCREPAFQAKQRSKCQHSTTARPPRKRRRQTEPADGNVATLNADQCQQACQSSEAEVKPKATATEKGTSDAAPSDAIPRQEQLPAASRSEEPHRQTSSEQGNTTAVPDTVPADQGTNLMPVPASADAHEPARAQAKDQTLQEQAASETPGNAQPSHSTPKKAKPPEAQHQPSSQGTASESRPSFLSMLQSKMEKQRQKRQESQSQSASHSDGSLSDSSLASVHNATPAQPASAHAAKPSSQSHMSPAGTRAPEAFAAPRHKIAMQKRQSAKKATAKKASKTRAFAQPRGDPRKALWHPPASPYGLIEEYLYEDPWKLLVACMLLNVTAGKQVRKVLWKLFEIWPNAGAAAEAMPDTLSVVETLIQPLGLFRKRTMAIKRFSKEYLESEWVDPIQLHGIGQYASDAYFMFCRGLWCEVSPTDKDLLKYQQWLQSTNGEGTGLERDVMPSPASEGNASQPVGGAKSETDNQSV